MASPLHKWLFSPPPSPKRDTLPTRNQPASDSTSGSPTVTIFSSSVVNVESQRIPKSSRSGFSRTHSPLLASMKPLDIEAANSEYPLEKRSPLSSPLLSPMFKAKVAHYVPRPVQRLLAVMAALLFFAAMSKYTTTLFGAAARPAPLLGERDYVPPQAAIRAPGE